MGPAFEPSREEMVVFVLDETVFELRSIDEAASRFQLTAKPHLFLQSSGSRVRR